MTDTHYAAPSAPSQSPTLDADDMRHALSLWCDVERARIALTLHDLNLVEVYARYRLVPPDELAVMMLEMGLTPPGYSERGTT